MVALKEYELSVNLESISFQNKKENVDEWYKLTRSYFEHQTFSICDERKVNRDLCSQFNAKHESDEYYVFKFFLSGRILINTKNNRKELLENRIPDLEKEYKIVFKIKGAKFSAETMSETTTPSRTSVVPESVVSSKEGEKNITSKNSIDNTNVENSENINSIQENALLNLNINKTLHVNKKDNNNQTPKPTNSNVYNVKNLIEKKNNSGKPRK